ARFWNGAETTEPLAAEPLLMETEKPTLLTNQGREPAAKGPLKGLVGGGLHYIRSADGREELFSLDSDPEERRNLADRPSAQAALAGFRAILESQLTPRAH